MPTRPLAVHVVTRYLRGGSEQRLRDIVGSVRNIDHIVVVGAESDVDLAKRDLKADVVLEPRLVREVDPRHDLVAVARITALLRRTRCDIVITHQSKAGIIGRISAMCAGQVPAVHSLSMANFGEGYGPKASRLFALAERSLGRFTYAYAVVGTDLAGRFEAAGVPGAKLRVIRSGVQLPNGLTATSPRPDAFPAARPVVLYVGSLEARKNVVDLPRLLHEVMKLHRGERPFLAIAGDGPLADAVRDEVERLHLGQDVVFLGHVGDVAPLFRHADVAVLLSNAEGLPQVLVQSAAVGTPFVSYAVDGASELIELGALGRIVPLRDLDAAAREIADLLVKCGPFPHGFDLSSWQGESIGRSYCALLEEALRHAHAA